MTDTPTPDPTEGGEDPDVEVTPSVEPTPEPVPVQVGDVVTDEQVKDLPEDVVAYQTGDGTRVVVAPDEPLPEVVQQDLTTRLNNVDQSVPGSDAALLRAAERETGKRTAIVLRFYGATDDNDTERWLWGAGTLDAPIGTPVADKGTVVARAEAFIASQSNPETWALVVMDS